jgi:hypothetical protein
VTFSYCADVLALSNFQEDAASDEEKEESEEEKAAKAAAAAAEAAAAAAQRAAANQRPLSEKFPLKRRVREPLGLILGCACSWCRHR